MPFEAGGNVLQPLGSALVSGPGGSELLGRILLALLQLGEGAGDGKVGRRGLVVLVLEVGKSHLMFLKKEVGSGSFRVLVLLDVV